MPCINPDFLFSYYYQSFRFGLCFILTGRYQQVSDLPPQDGTANGRRPICGRVSEVERIIMSKSKRPVGVACRIEMLSELNIISEQSLSIRLISPYSVHGIRRDQSRRSIYAISLCWSAARVALRIIYRIFHRVCSLKYKHPKAIITSWVLT